MESANRNEDNTFNLDIKVLSVKIRKEIDL